MNPKTKSDKLSQLETEILDAESKVVHGKKEFEDISKLLRDELEQFEKDKVQDMHEAMQGFLQSVMENQQEVIHHGKFLNDDF